MSLHLELSRCFQVAEVGTGGDPLLQRLKENSLEVQHLRQAAKQRLHLRERCCSERRRQRADVSAGSRCFCAYLVFTEEGLRLQRRQVHVKQADQILTDTRTSFSFNRHKELYRRKEMQQNNKTTKQTGRNLNVMR